MNVPGVSWAGYLDEAFVPDKKVLKNENKN